MSSKKEPKITWSAVLAQEVKAHGENKKSTHTVRRYVLRALERAKVPVTLAGVLKWLERHKNLKTRSGYLSHIRMALHEHARDSKPDKALFSFVYQKSNYTG
jgi:hypothetical protein